MKIFISGIAGSGMSGIAQLALDLGFEVFGSDLEKNQAAKDLIKQGAKIHFNQSLENIQKIHQENQLDWFIHSSSIQKNHTEFEFAKTKNIKTSKRDAFLNFLIQEKNLKLTAIAGTHGKTTTTAMLVWLFKQFEIPVSYLIGTDLSWGKRASYEKNSQFFILEADEYDKNFLNYQPEYAVITSLEYDHPDTYPKQADYFQAFYDFTFQVKNSTFCYQLDFFKTLKKIKLKIKEAILDEEKSQVILKIDDGKELEDNIKINIFDKENQDWKRKKGELAGVHNRQNLFLIKELFETIQPFLGLEISEKEIQEKANSFVGTNRRFEKLKENLYSDYAHHPSEILATLQMASELNSKIIAVYQPHQNLRQLEIKEGYKNVFEKAEKVYWLPTFLTREKPDLEILKASELSQFAGHPNLELADLNQDLAKKIEEGLKQGYLVLCMGAGDVDAWVRGIINN